MSEKSAFLKEKNSAFGRRRNEDGTKEERKDRTVKMALRNSRGLKIKYKKHQSFQATKTDCPYRLQLKFRKR